MTPVTWWPPSPLTWPWPSVTWPWPLISRLWSEIQLWINKTYPTDHDSKQRNWARALPWSFSWFLLRRFRPVTWPVTWLPAFSAGPARPTARPLLLGAPVLGGRFRIWSVVHEMRGSRDLNRIRSRDSNYLRWQHWRWQSEPPVAASLTNPSPAPPLSAS